MSRDPARSLVAGARLALAGMLACAPSLPAASPTALDLVRDYPGFQSRSCEERRDRALAELPTLGRLDAQGWRALLRHFSTQCPSQPEALLAVAGAATRVMAPPEAGRDPAGEPAWRPGLADLAWALPAAFPCAVQTRFVEEVLPVVGEFDPVSWEALVVGLARACPTRPSAWLEANRKLLAAGTRLAGPGSRFLPWTSVAAGLGTGFDCAVRREFLQDCQGLASERDPGAREEVEKAWEKACGGGRR